MLHLIEHCGAQLLGDTHRNVSPARNFGKFATNQIYEIHDNHKLINYKLQTNLVYRQNSSKCASSY